MSLWLVRAGRYGEYESKFLDESRIYLTWGDLTGRNLTVAADYAGIKEIVTNFYQGDSNRKIGNISGQIWAFVLAMQVGDWVVLPRKSSSTIAIGELRGPCQFDANAENDYKHYREVRWLNIEIPRNAFDQDLLYSFGAFMTVCQISRNDAERRVKAMGNVGWQGNAPGINNAPTQDLAGADVIQDEAIVDLEQLGRDTIARHIIQKFMGHGMARLVEAILKAQGFTTYLSPEGPDNGIDILAAGGAFGFSTPKICVQVKSGDTPVGMPEFTQLIGAMQRVQADQGLFVSWAGFKPTVSRDVPAQFFSVRIWNQNDLIDNLLENYDKIDQDVRAEIPLKHIWTLVNPDE